MNLEKRKACRVQGGWATQLCKPSAGRQSASAGTSLPRPAWQPGAVTGPTACVSQPLTFDASQQESTRQTELKTIDKAGRYTISTEPSGTSVIQLFPHVIEASDCEWMFEQLLAELPWQQRLVSKPGSEPYLQPRMTAWYGETSYSYAGLTHDHNTQWPPVLRMLKDRVEELTGFTLNSLLCNLYRDGHDHVPWHSDDEQLLGPLSNIASLSFGDTRNFELRKKPVLSLREGDNLIYTEFIKVPLDAGSILTMEGAVQQDWQHRVAREYHDRGPRVNLTFRTVLQTDETS